MNTEMTFESRMEIVASHAGGKLLAGRVDRVGVVLFNQPERRNAVTQEMWEGVCSSIDLFGADDAVRVVVYAGAGGKAFTAGSDVSQFATRRDSAEANAIFVRVSAKAREKMLGLQKPSIACIQGFCLGGGLGTALMADLRVADARAVFGIPAARLGLAYGIEPMERLVQLVGPARARLMLYTARRFSAQEAFDMGLVEVLAGANAVEETLTLAQGIAQNAPLSILAAKFAIEQVLLQSDHRDHAAAAEHTRRCMDSHDYREGRTAFMDKRPPRFTGA